MSDRNKQDEFEEIDDEDAIEGEYLPTERPMADDYMPAPRPGWAKTLAWTTLVLGVVYIINPTAGILELVPDNIPFLGNLDEATVLFLMYTAAHYLGIMPEFLERWTRQVPRLPPPRDRRE